MPAKTKPTAKRILIVDDHPMMRNGLAQLIDNEPDLKAIAEAGHNARKLPVTHHDTVLIGGKVQVRPAPGGLHSAES